MVISKNKIWSTFLVYSICTKLSLLFNIVPIVVSVLQLLANIVIGSSNTRVYFFTYQFNSGTPIVPNKGVNPRFTRGSPNFDRSSTALLVRNFCTPTFLLFYSFVNIRTIETIISVHFNILS